MAFKIICPYCFAEMDDTQVHFRSEVVHYGDGEIIPEDYDDVFDFSRRYMGSDKNEILMRYRDWEFFMEGDDPQYNEFWEKYSGTTEYSTADDEILNIPAYKRKVIDPQNEYHQKFLRKQSSGYFIFDQEGMVKEIQLVTGERCNRRVCCRCHNPLPPEYGKSPVKFTAVIGITGAGKTVYMSQLLKKMTTYAAKVALSAQVTTPSVITFLKNNAIGINQVMPGSTPAKRFQQPLFFDMTRENGVSGRLTETFVMYDVAGEVFEDANLVSRFAPFIEHANGLIVLLDPLQFDSFADLSPSRKKYSQPITALQSIQNIISRGRSSEKIGIPAAICLAKADQQEVQEALPDELKECIREEVRDVENSFGDSMPMFNAEEYFTIGRGLRQFIRKSDPALYTMMRNNYLNYSFFAFSALGCEVQDGMPVGPVLPKRIEEPLLWMFYKLGYIGKNKDLPWDVTCPYCAGNVFRELLGEEQMIEEKFGPFNMRRRIVTYNRQCQNENCFAYFNVEE